MSLCACVPVFLHLLQCIVLYQCDYVDWLHSVIHVRFVCIVLRLLVFDSGSQSYCAAIVHVNVVRVFVNAINVMIVVCLRFQYIHNALVCIILMVLRVYVLLTIWSYALCVHVCLLYTIILLKVLCVITSLCVLVF